MLSWIPPAGTPWEWIAWKSRSEAAKIIDYSWQSLPGSFRGARVQFTLRWHRATPWAANLLPGDVHRKPQRVGQQGQTDRQTEDTLPLVCAQYQQAGLHWLCACLYLIFSQAVLCFPSCFPTVLCYIINMPTRFSFLCCRNLVFIPFISHCFPFFFNVFFHNLSIIYISINTSCL